MCYANLTLDLVPFSPGSKSPSITMSSLQPILNFELQLWHSDYENNDSETTLYKDDYMKKCSFVPLWFLINIYNH